MSPLKDREELLKEAVRDYAFITGDNQRIANADGSASKWMFNFRAILLQPEYLDAVAELFWEKYKDKYPFQVCGMEVASIPLVAAIIMKSVEKGWSVNGFFLRKSRKKQGLMKMFEGKITDDPIIIIDDLINTGNSIMRQITALEGIGRTPTDVFTILHLREREYYYFLKERDIDFTALFPVTEFGIDFIRHRPEKFLGEAFEILWRFQSERPNFFYVIPKSVPVLDDTRVYFGSDNGYFWALNQNDGSVAWKYKVGPHPRGKSIFSSPAIHDGVVYFGSYDGNVYALDAAAGKKKWAFMEADWIGSSPALAPEINTLFVGLEFGLIGKQGGIAAIDMATGKKKWEHITGKHTHASPAYLASRNTVVVGSNDARVYAYNAQTGALRWQLQTEGEVKSSCAFDEKRGDVLFGSFDGKLYIVNVKTGAVVHTHQAEFGIYSTPYVHNDVAYFSSLDKHLYCIDLKKNELKWKFATSGRIFASPTVIHNKVYIGSNDGRLYELEPETGEMTGFLQVSERITNKVTYNKDTDRFFLPTFANELYCIERRSDI